jgi:hypothetical protein
MNLEDALGRMQDDLARLRYDLVRGREGSEDFRDCRTNMDVHRRVLELKGEAAFARSVEEISRQQFPGLPGRDAWVAQVVLAVQAQDGDRLDALYRQATLGRIF